MTDEKMLKEFRELSAEDKQKTLNFIYSLTNGCKPELQADLPEKADAYH